MQGMDGALDRIYQRLGWRIIYAYQAFAVLALGAALTPLGAAFARVQRLSFTEALELEGVLWALVVSMVVSSWIIRRSSRPLIQWLESDRDSASVDVAWRVVWRLPQTTARWNVTAFALAAPFAILGANQIRPLSVGAILWMVLGLLTAVGLCSVGTLFLVQLAVRPMARDIARSLTARPPWSPGVSVRMKLMTGIPILMLGTVGWGAAIGLEPGANWIGALPRLLIAMGVLAALGFPGALLLAFSILQPLEDVLQATERLSQGDLATRVPEVSGDEHGLVARSFNDAMVGLAERQQLASENVRLLGEVTDLLEQVRASRARIVAASDAERRRVERNIHDGAQQQLVALAVKLRMLEDQTSDQTVRAVLVEIGARLKVALDELRELARGLHPSVLTTDGLAPALEQLAGRVDLPVTVDVPDDRFAEAIESTAYFVASEALANVAKYACASTVRVLVEPRNGHLVVEVADDGIGGAHTQAGSGLTGLLDRLAALDGTLTIDSPAGHGTRVIAELPLS